MPVDPSSDTADRAARVIDRYPLTTPRHAGDRSCRLIEWKPWPFDNPSLLGHCAIAFSGGWCVNSIPIFRKGDGSLSVGVPNAAQIDSDGRIKVRDGKRQYVAVLSFETAEGRARWQRMVLGALAAGGITSAAGAAA
jgi:hypothetical protein